ncbi:hypothetical protein L7F22_045483 [Adiantum nelumboides]|nr:hypothetical protein [Adiantum nelumboides]
MAASLTRATLLLSFITSFSFQIITTASYGFCSSGFDVNSVVSLAYADSSPESSFYPRLFLYNNYPFTAWIDYNVSLNIPPLVPDIRRYTHKELRMATQVFSKTNKVGEGAFSVVYKGTSDDGSLIAVKKLKQGIIREKEFKSEFAIIGACRHRNLLKLQGWCYENGEAMLVCRFMKRGSFDHYLYSKYYVGR